MEADRRSSLRRKPLSDCTNTVVASRRNHPSSPAKSAASLVKPPKSSNPSSAAVVTTTTTAAAATNKSNPAASTNSSSLKLETSTGSNISPNVPAPPTPLTHSDVRDHRKPRLPATQSQRQDVKTRKDKGKMVLETPIVQASNLFSPWTQELLSSASGNCNLPTHPAVHSKKPDAQTRKDKGKMVLEASNIKRSDIMAPHATLLMTSSVSGIHDEERPDLLTVKKRRRKHADGITILASSCPPGKKRKGSDLGTSKAIPRMLCRKKR